MNETFNRGLIRRLRLDGVVLAASKNRIRVGSPRGVITPEIREVLSELKPDLLEALEIERGVLGLSVREFIQQNQAIEVKVPWLKDTLWFVPSVRMIPGLMADGVSRGRIWTGRELLDLCSVAEMPREDIVNIAKLKAALGIEILSVESVTGSMV